MTNKGQTYLERGKKQFLRGIHYNTEPHAKSILAPLLIFNLGAVQYDQFLAWETKTIGIPSKLQYHLYEKLKILIYN